MEEEKTPEPVAGALIFNNNNEILLVKSHKWGNIFVIPGGCVEFGETLESALRREIKEETGLDIRNIEFIDFHEFICSDNYWKKKHFIFFDHACKTDSAEVTLDKENQEYMWISLEEALKLPIEDTIKKTIRKYMKKSKKLISIK